MSHGNTPYKAGTPANSRKRGAPKKRRRPRVDLKRWSRTHWLATPIRLLPPDRGPLIVGVSEDAKQSVKDRWL